MRTTASLVLGILLLAACKEGTSESVTTENRPPHLDGVSVLTQHNDNSRAGWNDKEVLLTTSNVNVQHFGKVFTLPVDDQVYAQPLVAANVAIAGGQHNVVFVATVSNSVYAYDGDNGSLYWQQNFTSPGMRPPKNTDMTGACGGNYSDFNGNIGIVGTPVIDGATHIMYFVTRGTNGTTFVQHLHAVGMVDGHELPGSPVAITATTPGDGAGNVGGVITFDVKRNNQRQALTLVNGVVYITWSSHCDWGPFHGWILGYDAATLRQRITYNVTPRGESGGIWESGTGMAADADGNLYVVTSNGSVGTKTDPTALVNRGESALKLVPADSTLRVASWFTPDDYQFLNDNDLDYGGMGAFLIPGSSFLVTGAKDGTIYLLNKDDMGGYSASASHVQQIIRFSVSANMHCEPAYYRGASKEYVYVWSENDPLRAIPFDRATNLLDESGEVVFSSGIPTGQSGAVLSVSSNGSKDGTAILWAAHAVTGDAEHDITPGILRAFDATNVTKELWNNRQNIDRDGAGAYAKFASPTVANGHVYLPTFSHQVVVYGLQ